MSRETIGGKDHDQWTLYLLKCQELANLVLNIADQTRNSGFKESADHVLDLYDALLNIYVLAEFVVDHHDWKEKKKNIQ